MLDNSINQSVNIKPACTGTLQKSHPKAFFTRCHTTSEYWKKCIEKAPTVLQIMLYGDGWAIVEMLPDEVYAEMINDTPES